MAKTPNPIITIAIGSYAGSMNIGWGLQQHLPNGGQASGHHCRVACSDQRFRTQIEITDACEFANGHNNDRKQ